MECNGELPTHHAQSLRLPRRTCRTAAICQLNRQTQNKSRSESRYHQTVRAGCLRSITRSRPFQAHRSYEVIISTASSRFEKRGDTTLCPQNRKATRSQPRNELKRL